MCTVGIADRLDNGSELGLERGTTHEETIDIRLGNQVSTVARVGRPTVLDPGCSCNLSRHVLSEPLPHVGMCVLGNGWSGSLACTNSPDGFISDHNSRPLLYGALNSIKLLLKDVVGLTSLSLLKCLTNAEDSLETGGLSLGDLLSNDFVSLTEELSTLGVAHESPL